MPFEVVRNDITNMRVDAIVNTANPHPVIGSGTDSAIHRKAGPDLLEARKKIGDIRPGHSVATPAFALHAKYVLHTVSPAWIDGSHREPELLRQAYDAALQLAAEKGCKSIAFPLMAAGSYGFPKDKALSIAIQAFTDFLLTSDMMIYLVIFNGRAFSLAGSLFADLKSYIDENYVAEQTAQEYSGGRERRRDYYGRWDYDPVDSYSCNISPAAPCEDAPLHAKMSVSSAAPLPALLDDTEETFTEAVLRLLHERGEKDSLVYRRANMSRQLFNKIISDRYYQPKKNTAIQLAIGLELDLQQTQELLGKAGYILTRSSKTDLVVQYYILRGEYNLITIDTALSDANMPTLCRY